MFHKLILVFAFIFLFQSCSKKEITYEAKNKADPYVLYQEGFEAFEQGDYFFAETKFSEAELNFETVEYAAKAAIMASYALYGINFYDEALVNLDRYIKKYPGNIKNSMYAHYLIAIIHYEQISDEKKDLKPLIEANNKIDFFLKEYPDSDYAIDLNFKKDLIRNQIAAKEIYVAKYYISSKKWIAAINRLKVIVEKYDDTVFIEEALHRLVEIHYHIGLEEEANNYAKILGYNYNSSEWFAQSFKVLNKNYKIIDRKKITKNESFFKKIIKKIK
jgi:outer membrane protein assembly factor BamD